MFGKLMSFEFRSSIKMLAAVWAGLIATSAFFGVALRLVSGSSSFDMIEGVVTSTASVLFFAFSVALIVITIMVIIQRFNKGLLGEEGYLMHTLPVREWQLITSKGLCATLYVIAGCIIGILAICIIVVITAGRIDFLPYKDILLLFRKHPYAILVTFEVILMAILTAVAFIYQIYTSLAVGQLVNKHRIILAIGAFIGINTVQTILESVFILAAGNSQSFMAKLASVMSGSDLNAVLSGGQPYIICVIAVIILQIGIFHVVTERILSLKLNLQ